MKINVSGISKSIDAKMTVNGELNIPFVDYMGENIPVNTPICLNALITNTGDSLLISGRIKANLQLKCSRCLESFDYLLDTDFEEEFSNKDSNEDVIHFEGDILDITDIIVNNIVLALPMKVVCSEECKGLCPRCGKNINFDKCNCKEDEPDPRLAVLKNLFKDTKEV